jgi:hypothetical protein
MSIREKAAEIFDIAAEPVIVIDKNGNVYEVIGDKGTVITPGEIREKFTGEYRKDLMRIAPVKQRKDMTESEYHELNRRLANECGYTYTRAGAEDTRGNH